MGSYLKLIAELRVWVILTNSSYKGHFTMVQTYRFIKADMGLEELRVSPLVVKATRKRMVYSTLG